MPKTKHMTKRKPKKEPEVVLIRPPYRGNIDPKLIRKAVIAVWKERLNVEENERTKPKNESNGDLPPTEV